MALALLSAGVVQAAETLRIGVRAIGAKSVSEAWHQPLADHLMMQLPGVEVELAVLNQSEMAQAIAHRRLDLVLTDPLSYRALRSTDSVSNALATLITRHDGHATPSLGGVIISAADQPAIAALADLKGRWIAVASTRFLGGYSSQAFELVQAGLVMPDDVKLEVVDTYDAVIGAVLEGRVQAGFVRSGVIEKLTAAGMLDPARLRVVNRQKLADYPYVVSTRLYPEWPIAALPHVEERTGRGIANALFAMQPDLGTGIGGFAPPADYREVENLARALHLIPYGPPATSSEFERWQEHRSVVIGGLLAVIFIGIQFVQLARGNRHLARTAKALAEANAAQKAILSAMPHPVMELDAAGRVLEIWANNRNELSFDRDHMLGRTVAELLPEKGSRQAVRAVEEALVKSHVSGILVQTFKGFWFELSVSLVQGSVPPRFILLTSNVSDRRREDEQRNIAASVFTQASDGIVIAAASGQVVEINDAYTAITGYSRDEVIGQSAYDFIFSLQRPGSSAGTWNNGADIEHWQGEVRNRRKSGELYPAILTINAVRDAEGRLTHHVAALTDITLIKEQQRQLENIAYHDALTGLPNRALLADRLQQAMAQTERRGDRLAVLYLDLDAFKAVNDTHGHTQGDALLISVARRLKEVLREGDTLARMGGDEFVAVLTDLRDEQDCAPLISRLLAAASEAVLLDDLELRVSASIGVSFYPQEHEVGAEHLLRQADQALYQAKLAGKNRHYVYDSGLDDTVRTRHENLQEIRQAIAAGEFVLHYQPQVNMRTGEIIGAEALIRWQHPTRGLLAPAAFLPAIEDHAVSVELGEWVIDSALTQIETWQAAGLDVQVSVNVGGRQLQQVDFVDRLRLQLAAHAGVRPGCLELEVLETSALEDIDRISGVMAACRDIDVSFAIDDFGTGYSSLLYLKHLPAGRIKIDQSFVRGMLDNAEDLAILDGVVGLAAAFGRQVIAEGVETREQGELLLRLGCQFGQGFGIARPMPAQALPAWIASWRPDPAWIRPQPQVSRDELPLLFCDVEHRAWIRGIEAHFRGEHAVPLPLDRHECRFAQWVGGEGRRLHAAHPAFQALQTVHKQGHALADELLALHAGGRTDDALARIGELHAFQDVLKGYLGGFLRAGVTVHSERLEEVA